MEYLTFIYTFTENKIFILHLSMSWINKFSVFKKKIRNRNRPNKQAKNMMWIISDYLFISIRTRRNVSLFSIIYLLFSTLFCILENTKNNLNNNNLLFRLLLN